MKRLLIALLFALPAMAGTHDWTLYPPRIPAARIAELEPPQTVNTFCAININCTVTAAWTFTGPASLTNLYNLSDVKIIDGIHYGFTAAGINQADSDLGSAAGEIWIVPGATAATDAQISLSASHTLRIFGQLKIDAIGKGPILMGNSSAIVCAQNNQGSNGGSGQILNSTTGTIPAMIQATTQDGSLETFYVEGCTINAGSNAVTRGVIDFSGMNDHGKIAHNRIYGLTSGWALYAVDIQSGLLAGTSNSELADNWIVAGGTGGCITINHSGTNGVFLQAFQIRGNECQLNSSTITTAPILIQNTNTSAGNLRYITVQDTFISGVPVGQPSITVNGVSASTFKNVWCAGNGPCISVPNNSNNQGLTFEGLYNAVATNTLVDTANSVTLANPYVYKYVYPLSGSPASQIDLSMTGGQASHGTATAYVTSTYTNATTTPSNVSGLSFIVGANQNYNLSCHLFYQGSASTAGLAIALTGPASPTSLFYSIAPWLSVGSALQNTSLATSFGTTINNGGAITATTNLEAIVSMGLRNGTNNGTVQVQAAATGAGTLTIQTGSYCALNQ